MNDEELNIEQVLKDGVRVLVEQLKLRIEYLNDFKIRTYIGDADKEDPTYSRSMAMADSLPKFITEISKLRSVGGEEEKPEQPEVPRMQPVTPQSISKMSKTG